jgi:hypothetical protein
MVIFWSIAEFSIDLLGKVATLTTSAPFAEVLFGAFFLVIFFPNALPEQRQKASGPELTGLVSLSALSEPAGSDTGQARRVFLLLLRGAATC